MCITLVHVTPISSSKATRSRNTSPTITPVPRQTRPNLVMMSFRLPPELKDKLYAKAEQEGVNPTEVLRDLVAEWVASE